MFETVRARSGSPPPTTKRGRRTRDLSIETLRGIAIILMVAGHVVGADGSEGMRVADDSAWRTTYVLLSDLRLPLFTALSGFVYGMRPLQGPVVLPGFLRGKARRLLVPLITVGTTYALLQLLIPGTNGRVLDWWKLYFTGMWHFWFLQSIFLLLIGIGLANAFGRLTSRSGTVLAIALAALVAAWVRVPHPFDVFSINGAIRLAPFFLLGYAIKRFWPARTLARWPLLLATIALFTVRCAQVLGGLSLPGPVDAVIGVSLGIAGIGSLLAFRYRFHSAVLARLGYFSFAIYLMHIFGTAPARMALTRLGVEQQPVIFVVALTAGLALPILFEISFGRISWISWAFLGQKPYRGV